MDKEIPLEVRRRRRLMRWGRFAVVAAVAVGALAYVIGVSRSEISLGHLQQGVADVGTIESTVSASGRVKPGLEEIITSPISSRIMRVYKRAGDLVEEGEPLLQLDLTTVQTQYDQMLDEGRMKEYQLQQFRVNTESSLRELEMRLKVKEMSVNSLAMELRNERYLDSIGSGTGDNVRRAQYALATGRLELEQMRQALADTRSVKSAEMRVRELEMEIFRRKLGEMERTLTDARILSPRRAVLTQITSGIGSQIGAGSQVAVVSELDHYKVECEIADSYADRVGAGSRVAIKIGRTVIDGMVSDLSPVSQNGVISFTVQPDNESDPVLRSGLRAEVYVKTNVIDDAVRIPNGPYYSSGPGDYSLYVVNADTTELELRRVALGQSNYEYVEVVSGLSPGERVITSDMTPYKKHSILKIKK